VRGVSKEARAKAAKAASRRRETIGEWVTNAVIRAANEELGSGTRPTEPVAPSMAPATTEAPPPPSAPEADAGDVEPDALLTALERRLSRRSDLTVTGVGTPDQGLEEMARALLVLAQRSERTGKRERAVLLLLKVLIERIERNQRHIEAISSRLKRLGGPQAGISRQDGSGAGSLETAIRGLIDRLPPAEPTNGAAAEPADDAETEPVASVDTPDADQATADAGADADAEVDAGGSGTDTLLESDHPAAPEPTDAPADGEVAAEREPESEPPPIEPPPIEPPHVEPAPVEPPPEVMSAESVPDAPETVVERPRSQMDDLTPERPPATAPARSELLRRVMEKAADQNRARTREEPLRPADDAPAQVTGETSDAGLHPSVRSPDTEIPEATDHDLRAATAAAETEVPSSDVDTAEVAVGDEPESAFPSTGLEMEADVDAQDESLDREPGPVDLVESVAPEPIVEAAEAERPLSLAGGPEPASEDHIDTLPDESVADAAESPPTEAFVEATPIDQPTERRMGVIERAAAPIPPQPEGRASEPARTEPPSPADLGEPERADMSAPVEKPAEPPPAPEQEPLTLDREAGPEDDEPTTPAPLRDLRDSAFAFDYNTLHRRAMENTDQRSGKGRRKPRRGFFGIGRRDE
jgi:hypothetical protein